jgi:hypothetical protein
MQKVKLKMALQISIAVVDANGLRICENLDQFIVNSNRQSFFSRFRDVCSLPDFFLPLASELSATNPSVFVLATINGAQSNTYLHSEFLPNNMGQLGYTFISRDDSFDKNKLSISIYVKAQIVGLTLGTKEIVSKLNGNKASYDDYNNRAMVAYLSLSGFGNVAFLLYNVDPKYDSIKASVEKKDDMYRQSAINRSCSFINATIQTFTKDTLVTGIMIDYVFVLGDLGMRTRTYSPTGMLDIPKLLPLIETENNQNILNSLYTQYDELYLSKKANIVYNLQEGVNDKGPDFRPTCEYRKGRDKSCITGCYDISGIAPSWCIRCSSLSLSGKPVNCLKYMSIPSSNFTAQTSFAAIYSIYELIS